MSGSPDCAPSDDDVPLDQEGRDLGDEDAGMRHHRDALRRCEGPVQRFGAFEPELDDAIDRQVLVADRRALGHFAADDQVLPIPVHAMGLTHQACVFHTPFMLEAFRRHEAA